jgi:hypothetical protein
MRKATAIACVLVDVGGVLLTDGWDHHARKRAARTFNWSASVIVALSFLTPRKILGKSATFWWYKAVIHASC